MTLEIEFLFSLAGYAVYVFFESVDVLALFAQNIERVFYCVKLIFILALTLLSLLHRVKVFLYARKHFVEFSVFGGNLYLTVADILVISLELLLIIGKVFFCRRKKLFYLLLFYSVIFKTLFVFRNKSFVRKHSRARSLLRTAANRTCSTQHVAFQCNYTYGISVLSRYQRSVVDIVYYKSTPEQRGKYVVVFGVVFYEFACDAQTPLLPEDRGKFSLEFSGLYAGKRQEGKSSVLSFSQICDYVLCVLFVGNDYVLKRRTQSRLYRRLVILRYVDEVGYNAEYSRFEFAVEFGVSHKRP